MTPLKSLLAGFAGAVALNILHETIRQFDPEAPRVDLIGEEALEKSLKTVSVEPPEGEKLYLATLAGDLLSNTLYYSLIGSGKNKNAITRGIYYGLSAGLGAVFIPKPVGLDETPVTKTQRTAVMTVGYYLFGALVTAGVLKIHEKRS